MTQANPSSLSSLATAAATATMEGTAVSTKATAAAE
jgi:hypothetical protein